MENGSERTYLAIDLKSFYASVECAERGLNPLTTNLVVADLSRTEKTICLAVTPALKGYGISGRARLYEVVEKVKEINARRLRLAPGHRFTGSSCDAGELERDLSLSLDYITAKPRMRYYMQYSGGIFNIYLRFVAPEDIHVYSIDEVFIDVTDYLRTYRLTARELAIRMIREVLRATGITATCGIGTNLYLAKIAMDIVAKKSPPDADGVRIAELDEISYRKLLWTHRPLTDFWRIGRGYERRLEELGLYTMGDIARCSLGGDSEFYNEALLYRTFGVNAELLIDHAWGWEPTEIADCKAYRPESRSLSQGQVLSRPYSAEEGRVVVREMADMLAMDLVRKGFYTDQVVLDVSYDVENLSDPERAAAYQGPVALDYYGRKVPKRVHGSRNLGRQTTSASRISAAVCEIFDRIVDPNLTLRRFSLAVTRLVTAEELEKPPKEEQLDLFTDYEEKEREEKAEEEALQRERRVQEALLDIRDRFGKNAVVKGLNLRKGATALERNRQIGGHKA